VTALSAARTSASTPLTDSNAHAHDCRTGIEQWSSPSTLAKCASHWPVGPSLPKPGNLSNCIHDLTQHGEFETEGPWCSTLYDVMIKPFAPMASSAILWYQGENNVCPQEWDGSNNASQCPPSTGGDFYACAMEALIHDWRALFQPADFASEPELPFIQAMLDGFAHCSCSKAAGPCIPPQPDVPPPLTESHYLVTNLTGTR
jgi:hypothetical protein